MGNIFTGIALGFFISVVTLLIMEGSEPTEVEAVPHVDWEVVSEMGQHLPSGFTVYRFAVKDGEYLIASHKAGGMIVLDRFIVE